MPVTVWHGQQDRLVPVAGIIHLAGRLPQVRVHLLDGHGHLLDLYSGTLRLILRAAKDNTVTTFDQGLGGYGTVR